METVVNSNCMRNVGRVRAAGGLTMNEFFESLRCDARRPLLFPIKLCEKETIVNYQDRLGTNVQKVEVKGRFAHRIASMNEFVSSRALK